MSLRRRRLRLWLRMRVGSDENGSSASSELAERDPDTPEVLQVLLDNHARFLAFLERRVGSRDEAEDILQEAFVRSLDHASSLGSSSSATAWFYRVLRNAITDHYRRQDSQGRALDRLAAETESSDAPDSELERVVCQCVLSLVETLKPQYGAAIRRVDLDGLSIRDFAAEAGVTAGNAGVRLHRAREALARQVARSCGTCLKHGCIDCSCAA
ncbi:MAG TPA: RNA polymerase sigma factor [Gemmatimonadales bacterium]|nr:RNA polymerase sigma factor [Gemmatimonadales bacterium]